jgi:hypothetical protein
MSAVRAATLAHDVGRYVARVAHNIAKGEDVPGPLLPMLVRDLYALPSGARASARFDELAEGLPPDEALTQARALLAAIDALEPAVRAGEPMACREACAHAREVDKLLRGYAAEARRR